MSSSELKPNSPLFIVGYLHTGTTLLQNILKRAPELIILRGETHFIQDLGPIKRAFPDLNDAETRRDFTMYLVKLAFVGFQRANFYRDNYSLADLGLTEEQFDHIAAQVDEALAAAPPEDRYKLAFGIVNDNLAAVAGKSRWLEKTPQHVFFLKTIFEMWPDARVINLVRDPRAAISSRKIRRSGDWLERRIAADPLGTDQHTNFDPLIDAYLWKDAVQAGIEAQKKYKDQVLTVRYEDLVHEPEKYVRLICEFTGLTYSPDMLEIGWINSATHTTADRTTGGISTAAIDKWRKNLTPEEIFVCQSAVRQEMKELGYEPATVGFSGVAKSPLVLGTSASNLIGRLWSQPDNLQHRRTAASRRVLNRAMKSLGIQKKGGVS